jgi:hypothetical protein
MTNEKHDPEEALSRASARSLDPQVRSWVRRFERLMRDMPPDTRIYWQERHMNLMVLGPDGEDYVGVDNGFGASSDPNAVIAMVMVPRSDSGAW